MHLRRDGRTPPAPSVHGVVPAGAQVARRSPLTAAATFLGVQDAGRALRDFTSYLPTQVIPALVGALVLPLLARKLSPTYLGILAITQTLISLGWITIGGWVASAIIRELPRHTAAGNTAAFRRTLARGMAIVLVSAFAFYGLVSAGGAFSQAIADHELLIATATAGLAIQNIAVSLLAASLRPHAYLAVNVAGRVAGAGLGVTLVYLGKGIDGYLLGLTVASACAGLIGLAVGWPHRGETRAEHTKWDNHELHAWVAYGVPVAFSGFATWGLAFADRYVLAGFRDTAAVGVYSLGNTLGDRAIAIPATAFLTAAGPLLVTVYERQGRGEVERLMRAYTRVLILIGLPTIAFLSAAATPIVHVVSGSAAYDGAAGVIPIVGVGSLIYALSLIGYTGLIVSKHTLPMVYAGTIGLAVNVAANLVLIPPFGIIGAAVATPIGMLGFMLATQIWSPRYARWSFPWVTLGRATVAAGIGYGAALAASHAVHGSPLEVAVAFTACVGAYLATLGLVGERVPPAGPMNPLPVQQYEKAH